MFYIFNGYWYLRPIRAGFICRVSRIVPFTFYPCCPKSCVNMCIWNCPLNSAQNGRLPVCSTEDWVRGGE